MFDQFAKAADKKLKASETKIVLIDEVFKESLMYSNRTYFMAEVTSLKKKLKVI